MCFYTYIKTFLTSVVCGDQSLSKLFYASWSKLCQMGTRC